MKLTIHAAEGELEAKADPLVKAIRGVAGRNHADREPRKMDIPALQGSIDDANGTVERIRAVMVKNIERVLKGAA